MFQKNRNKKKVEKFTFKFFRFWQHFCKKIASASSKTTVLNVNVDQLDSDDCSELTGLIKNYISRKRDERNLKEGQDKTGIDQETEDDGKDEQLKKDDGPDSGVKNVREGDECVEMDVKDLETAPTDNVNTKDQDEINKNDENVKKSKYKYHYVGGYDTPSKDKTIGLVTSDEEGNPASSIEISSPGKKFKLVVNKGNKIKKVANPRSSQKRKYHSPVRRRRQPKRPLSSPIDSYTVKHRTCLLLTLDLKLFEQLQ